MAAHLSSRPVPPLEHDASLPPALNDAILMGIAKEPAQRFQKAAAFDNALGTVTALPVRTRVVAAGMAVPPVVSNAQARVNTPPPALPLQRTALRTQAQRTTQPAVPAQVPSAPPANVPSADAQVQIQSTGATQVRTAPEQPVPPALPVNQDDLHAARETLARETLMLLGTRAEAVKSTLATLKQQQARMGTNLRADIVTAEPRMEFYLDEAEAALRAGEAVKAKPSLQTAERALETIEKFLGR